MAQTVYLYIRHTPRMVKVFASEQVTPHGVSKVMVTSAHPLHEAIALHAKNVLSAFKAEFGRTGKRPTLQLAHVLAEKAGTMHGVEYAYIPQCATYPERVRITKA